VDRDPRVSRSRLSSEEKTQGPEWLVVTAKSRHQFVELSVCPSVVISSADSQSKPWTQSSSLRQVTSTELPGLLRQCARCKRLRQRRRTWPADLFSSFTFLWFQVPRVET
jgi:hypothetical protein